MNKYSFPDSERNRNTDLRNLNIFVPGKYGRKTVGKIDVELHET